MKRLVADQMVEYLERRNVEYIFGLCGHTVIGFWTHYREAKN